MSTSRVLPPRVNRAVFAGILLYFGLVVLGGLTANPYLNLAAYVLFGVIALGIGVVFNRLSDDPTDLLSVASICMLTAAVAQFAWVVAPYEVFTLLSTVGVLGGIGIYLYLVWVKE